MKEGVVYRVSDGTNTGGGAGGGRGVVAGADERLQEGCVNGRD